MLLGPDDTKGCHCVHVEIGYCLYLCLCEISGSLNPKQMCSVEEESPELLNQNLGMKLCKWSRLHAPLNSVCSHKSFLQRKCLSVTFWQKRKGKSHNTCSIILLCIVLPFCRSIQVFLYLLFSETIAPPPDLESVFFDLEIEMENGICRDLVCTSEEKEAGMKCFSSLLC